MRNIDRFRAMSLEELAPYFVHRTVINGSEVWCSPSGYTFSNKGKMYSLEGFGKKSVDKLLESIEKSRKTTLDRFIYALSVPMIGKSASKDIAKHFKYNFEEFYHCFSCGYGYFWNLKVDGIGVVASNNIQKFAITYMDKVFELSKEFTFKIPSESNNAQNTLQVEI